MKFVLGDRTGEKGNKSCFGDSFKQGREGRGKKVEEHARP